MSTVTTTRSAALSRASTMHVRSARPSHLATSIDPLRVLRRHVLGIIVAAILGAVLGVVAFFVLMRVYPLYSSKVLFEVQPGLQQAGQVGVIDTTDDNMVFRIAQTETYMLTSRVILDKALKNPDIKQTEWYKKFLYTDSDGKEVPNWAEAVDELEEDIGTSVVRSSNLFTLSWSTHKPEDAPIVLNAIADAYLNERKARDREVYDSNLTLFQRQLESTQDTLDDLDKEMRNLIKIAHMTELEGVWRSAQAVKQLELTKQLTEATHNLSLAQTNHHLASQKLEGKMEYEADDVFQAEHDQAIMTMIENIEHLKARLRELKTTRDHDNAMVRDMEIKIRAQEEQRDAKLQEIIRRNLEAKMRTYAQDMERFGRSVEKFEAQMAENTQRLEELAANQAQYEAMATQRAHLEEQRTADRELINEVELMRLRADASRVRRAQQALMPREPSFPKPEIIIPLGVLLCAGLTIGIVFLRELMDQRIKSASDLAVLPGAHVLGDIPDLMDDPTKTQAAESVVRQQPTSVLSESYRQVSTALLPQLDRSGHQTLLVLAGLPGSGTTTVVTNLAAAASATGRRVLVVDANFRRPRLAEAMGVSGEGMGLADLLSGTSTIDDAIVEMADGVSVIPAGTPANRVFDRLNNGTFDSVVAELRGRFDLILFDAPPAVVAGDALVLANKVDAALLVVRAHQEHRGLIARLINRLSDTRCELLGVLLNRPRGIAGGYLKKNYATMAEYGASPTA